MKRLALIATICIALVALTRFPAEALDAKLTIGSKAPSLDIEHWVQDGNGFFKPVTKFKQGKVYVVEFWATWCGPCIMSMPHLAELQNKYRGRDVQIVGVSDETLDEVKDLMTQTHPQAGKTFEEITSAYSLTTDPDRSTYAEYMDASNQRGIPTSFIVGKSGKIEWIGHPAEIDEPLEAVVSDQWDREKFKKTFEERANFEKYMEKISMLAGAQKFKQAVELAEEQIKSVQDESLKSEWTSVRHSLKLSAGEPDEDVLAYYREQIKEMKGDPISMGRFGYSIFGLLQSGGKIGPLLGDVITALKAETKDVEGEDKVFFEQHACFVAG